MFKPLLRTLPTLSGNFSINCKLNDFEKINSNEYITYGRVANLTPLQNFLTNRDIEINLLNGKYEYDVMKYYYYYSNVFYKSNFNYNRNNYAIMDLNSIYNYNNDAHNKDYEFGCKRIAYSQNGYQFNFYAPFYVDNIDDLPEYFCISIVLNDHLTKNIKIYINKDNKKNYLKNYLSRYIKQIDERVIFCLPDSLQATYFGIDVKNGGITQYKDNVFGRLYTDQTTINNFDYTICKGFERNNLMMLQVIPISFSFNLNDIFNNYEKEFFNGVKFKVYGHYYANGGHKFDMYDFDINYTHQYNKYKKYNEYTGKYEYVIGKDSKKNPINVMNVDWPSLNESKYIKYEYTNKITPIYCKFKMLHSGDEDPYITNISFGYSYNQYPNQKYGYFPTMFKGIYVNGVINNDDFKLPIGAALDNYYKFIRYSANNVVTDTVNIDKYNKLMSNYYSYWYDINNYDFDFTDASQRSYLFNDNVNWSDVKYDTTYYHGILYNLKNLHKYNIDKFGIFCGVHINDIPEIELDNKLINASVILSADHSDSNKTYYYYNDAYDMVSTLTSGYNFFNKIIDVSNSKLTNEFVKINTTVEQNYNGVYIEETNYIEENTFYKISDIVYLINTYLNYNNKLNIINKLYEKIYSGFLLLEGYNNINYFDKYTDIYNQEHIEFMLNKYIYETEEYIPRFNWLKNKLYYTTQINKEKRPISKSYSLLSYNEDIYGKYCIFLKDDFIHKNDIYNVLNEFKEDLSEYNLMFNDLDTQVKNCIKYFENLEKNHVLDHNYKTIMNEIYNWFERKYIEIHHNVDNKFIEFVNSSHIYVIIQNIISEIVIKLGDDEAYQTAINNIVSVESQTNNMADIFIPILRNAQSYIYNIIGNENGIEISEYFSTIKNIDNDIYVDSYNINNLIDLYNKDNNEQLNKLTTLNSIYNKFYIKFIDKNHILEYCTKLKNNENNYIEIQKTNLLDILYVKERCWLIEENKIDIKDRYVTLFNYLKNILTERIKRDKGLNINELKKYVEDNQSMDLKYLQYLDTLFYYHSLIGSTNNNSLILQWILDNISETRSVNNNFSFIAFNEPIELNLCFSKKMILLNTTIRKLIETGYNIYLYTFDKCLIENKNIWPIISNSDLIANDIYDYKDYDNYLIPLFTDIYVNIKDKSTISKMLYNSKINLKNKYVIKNNKFFKEIDVDYHARNKFINDKQFVFNWIKYLSSYITDNNELSKIKQTWEDYCYEQNIYLENININDIDNYTKYVDILIEFIKNYNDLLYRYLINYEGIVLYSIKDEYGINYNKFDNIITDNYSLIYDSNYKIYIYKENNITYAFHWLSVDIDNTNISFNIEDDFNLNIRFNSINGVEIDDLNKTHYINQIFYLIEPFLKFSIFDNFTKNINTIIYPYEAEININYMSYALNVNNKIQHKILLDDDSDILYEDLGELNNTKKIKLLRYFNYITPYIKKTNIINDFYELKFMSINNISRNTKKYNILDKSDINIYKYNGIKYYNDEYIYNQTFEEFTKTINNETVIGNPEILKQNEYKHYNDNLLFNLPVEIIIEDNKKYTYNDLQELKNNSEKIKEYKKDILLEYFKKKGLEYDNIILFLFNKYDSNMLIEHVELRTTNKEKLYKVSYKFNLI